jgi:hypothetical protein
MFINGELVDSTLNLSDFAGELPIVGLQFNGNVTNNIAATDTWYPIIFSEVAVSNGNISATTSNINIAVEGWYIVGGSTSFQGQNNQLVTMSLFTNDVECVYPSTSRKIGTGTDVGSASAVLFPMHFDAGDVMTFRVKSGAVTGNIIAEKGGFACIKQGGGGVTKAYVDAADAALQVNIDGKAGTNAVETLNSLTNGWGMSDRSYMLSELKPARSAWEFPSIAPFKIVIFGDSYAIASGTPAAGLIEKMEAVRGTAGTGLQTYDGRMRDTIAGAAVRYNNIAGTFDGSLWPWSYYELSDATGYVKWYALDGYGHHADATEICWLTHANGGDFTVETAQPGGTWSTLATLSGYSASAGTSATNITLRSDQWEVRVKGGAQTNYVIGASLYDSQSAGVVPYFSAVGGWPASRVDLVSSSQFHTVLSEIDPDLVLFVDATVNGTEHLTYMTNSPLSQALESLSIPTLAVGQFPASNGDKRVNALNTLDMCKTNEWAFLDLQYPSKEYADMKRHGYMVDGDVHLTALGASRYADIYYDTLFGTLDPVWPSIVTIRPKLMMGSGSSTPTMTHAYQWGNYDIGATVSSLRLWGFQIETNQSYQTFAAAISSDDLSPGADKVYVRYNLLTEDTTSYRHAASLKVWPRGVIQSDGAEIGGSDEETVSIGGGGTNRMVWTKWFDLNVDVIDEPINNTPWDGLISAGNATAPDSKVLLLGVQVKGVNTGVQP